AERLAERAAERAEVDEAALRRPHEGVHLVRRVRARAHDVPRLADRDRPAERPAERPEVPHAPLLRPVERVRRGVARDRGRAPDRAPVMDAAGLAEGAPERPEVAHPAVRGPEEGVALEVARGRADADHVPLVVDPAPGLVAERERPGGEAQRAAERAQVAHARLGRPDEGMRLTVARDRARADDVAGVVDPDGLAERPPERAEVLDDEGLLGKRRP